MKDELEQQIINIAPYMFRYDNWDNLTEGLLGFGFMCGNGWFNLIKQLVTDLRDDDEEKIIRVFEVKEKFGGLRFYLNGYPGKADELTEKAEETSFSICEECGKNGNQFELRNWIYVRCPECKAKLEKDRL